MVRTAATLLVAEIAPTERLDCRRAFLNILATKERVKEKVEGLASCELTQGDVNEKDQRGLAG